ncbi:15709_t:CDS:2, partial [Funneliformis geosporum]
MHSDIPYNDQANALVKNCLDILALTSHQLLLSNSLSTITTFLLLYLSDYSLKINWKATTFCINNNIANGVTSYETSVLMK